MKITATHLYDYVTCPYRVQLDLHGDVRLRDEPSAFTELLWKHGNANEATIKSLLPITADISAVSAEHKEAETRYAMQRGEKLIYAGVITTEHWYGIPDLMLHTGNGYQPRDIKSGKAIEEETGKLKRDYAFQLAHYINILEGLGRSDGQKTGAIIDDTLMPAPYNLSVPQGIRSKQSLFAEYEVALNQVSGFVNQKVSSTPALCAACKLCHWKTHCKSELVEAHDLSLIPELGRGKRDTLRVEFPRLESLAMANVAHYVTDAKKGKTLFPGIGADTLAKYQERAVLLSTPDAQPYTTKSLLFPTNPKEIFWDIEDSPFEKFVYLHGFVERSNRHPDEITYKPVFTTEDEEGGFRVAYQYLKENIDTATVYHYAPYEKTTYRKLSKKYPAVCSEADMEALLTHPNMIDLYSEVVRKYTEWPLHDKSIKTIATYRGFKWRDSNPSGAASIEWFNQYLTTGNPEIRQRILDYNEDDCKATFIVLDSVKALPVNSQR